LIAANLATGLFFGLVSWNAHFTLRRFNLSLTDLQWWSLWLFGLSAGLFALGSFAVAGLQTIGVPSL
jgi:hypothetical protein